MKKITMLLCLLLCAAMLAAPLQIGAFATESTDPAAPVILNSMPYEATVTATANDEGICPSYFYRYTATRACRLVIAVEGGAVAIVTRNGEQVMGNVDMAEGDVIDIELFFVTAGTSTLKLSEMDFPLGSRQNPIPLEFSKLKSGFTFDLTQEDEIWYKVVAPETGVLTFTSTNMPWGFALGYNGNTTTDGCTVIQHYNQTGTRPVNAGETFLLCAEYGAAEPNSFKVKVEYVPPFTIDAATQKVMFNGRYDVKSEETRIYGVEFDYDSKTVSMMDFRNNVFVGTYNFSYNMENGALELTDNRGDKAPYVISVIEDSTKPHGAYLKLQYNGQYELHEVDPNEKIPVPEAAVDLMTGRFEDIFMGLVYETFIFDYKAGTVTVAEDWQSDRVVYNIVSYSAFSGLLKLQSEDGDIITMIAAGDKIIYNDNVLTEVHEHKYEENIIAPTCTEGGHTVFTCSCGDSYTGSETEALGHDWVPASCNDPKHCSRCRISEGEALGHTWVDATCDAPKTCSGCGETEGEALGHTWTDATCAAPKTCTTCGATEGEASSHKWNAATCDTAKTCADCGATEGETLGHAWANATCDLPKICTRCGITEGAALGHTWVNATCENAKTCSTCGATEGAALGHKWEAATCTTAKTCSTCGATEGAALGHAWVNATCENAKTCSTCGATEGAALGHNYGAWTADGDEHKKTCANCGDVIKEAHAWDDGVVTKEPTEDMDGEKKLTCSVCGANKTQVIPSLAHVHSYTATITDPTCTVAGYTTYTCRCGNSYIEEGAAALGHSYSSSVVAPTCTEAGYTTFTCSCGDSYVEEGAAALGHNYNSVVTAPTCVEGGYTTHTCSTCGDVKVDSPVDSLGHKYNSVVTAPTCAAGGYTTMTCSVCGYERVEHPTDALEHQFETAVTAPTCVEAGFTTYTCLMCGFEKVGDQVAALGHKYDSVVTEPTCTAGGYTTNTCSVCGDVKVDKETQPAGHDYVEANGVYTCTVCGHSYEESRPDQPTDNIVVPGTLTGVVDGTKEFTWIATEDGFLQIDNTANLTGAYHDVTINGEPALATEEGYAVVTGDTVVITITTFSAIEINIPLYINGNGSSGSGDTEMNFDVSWSADSWSGYQGTWYAPADGMYTFIIDSSNIAADRLTFRVIVDETWYNQYEFPLSADGKQYVTVSVFAGQEVMILAYDDAHTEAGELHIVVIEGAPEVHEHAYGEGVLTTEPTCTTEGVMTYTCSCGDTKTESVAKLAHTEEVIPGKAPTCQETGLTDGVKCSACGEIITAQTEIAVGEHTYGDWEIVKEATTTEEGSRKRVCSGCGAEEVESIPMVETQPTEPEATEPETKPSEPAQTQQPATTGGDNAGDEGGNGTIVIVIVAAVVIAGAVVAVVLLKKKK